MGRKRAHHGSRRRGRAGGARRRPEVVQGTIRILRPGLAELNSPEGTFPVARGGIHEAMDGDLVQASLSTRKGEGKLARVRGVIERSCQDFVGTFEDAGQLGAVVPLDGRIRHDFFVLPQDDSPRRLGVKPGDVVRATIREYPTRHSAGVVGIEERLGTQQELDLPIEQVIASYGLATDFPPAALEQARSIRVDVEAALREDPRRADLRGTVCMTVDPADARDFDDAVSARRSEDGYEVGVHIADVTHYVGWDSPLDNECKRRTCSAYLVDRVIPMLPEELSNEACSLKPGEDRLAMSVIMDLDASGHVRHARAMRSAIRSRARLDYGTVDRLLKGEIAAQELPCPADAAPAVAETLGILDEIRALREKVRRARGAIDFDTREARVILDGEGRPTGVSVRQRTRATGLIEEAMLIANESVAAMLSDAGLESAYRVHERPAPDDMKRVVPVLRELGLADGALAERIIAGDPHAVQDVLEKASGTPAAYPATALLLRAQKRAVYLPRNDGHYALGAKAYCHFTSPIRRYPDMLVHRTLKALLDKRAEGREQKRVIQQLPQLCRTCSEQERVADGAARASQREKMAELYAGRVGESFSGIVVGCERYGLFVELDDTCAEGLLPTRELGQEWFAYDDVRLSLTGESTGRTWRLGQRVAITVSGTDPVHGRIDFRLAGQRETPRRPTGSIENHHD